MSFFLQSFAGVGIVNLQGQDIWPRSAFQQQPVGQGQQFKQTTLAAIVLFTQGQDGIKISLKVHGERRAMKRVRNHQCRMG